MSEHKLLAGAAALIALSITGCSQSSNEPVETEAAASASEAPLKPQLPRTDAPEGASVYFVSPADGASVTSPVKVVFGADGVAVVPAGDPAQNSGHHHLLIDTGLPDVTQPIPKDAQHVHFGKGQTEAEIKLPAGTHTLQLLLGDYLHIPHQPPMTSEVITITVTE